MLKITVNNGFRNLRAGDVYDFTKYKTLKSVCVVGENGCGKSSLFQALRDKQRRKKFLLKLTNDNKYWWLSLSDDNKVSIIRYYTALPIIDIKKMYPANVAVVRELKLKELKI